MSVLTGDRVKEIIGEINPSIKESIKEDVPLRNQGIDSLDFSNILLNVEEESNLEIPDEDIDTLETIEDIVKYVNEKAGD